MEISKISDLIERFAPLDSQEKWDCSGFQFDFGAREIKKVMLCLSVTESIINQAVAADCDMIIAHHPLFFIPFTFNKNIPVYSAHTNLDKAEGGTTDSLIKLLGFDETKKIGEFSRLVCLKNEISLNSFVDLLKEKLNLDLARVVNNLDKQTISKIAFCAGSGIEFLAEAEANGADAFVTGDVKFHQALESNVIIIDIGHFESEYPILNTIKDLLTTINLEVIVADEKSPFINF